MITLERVKEFWVRGGNPAPDPELASNALDDLFQTIRFQAYKEGYEAGYLDAYETGFLEGMNTRWDD